jgi:hypothetical protein
MEAARYPEGQVKKEIRRTNMKATKLMTLALVGLMASSFDAAMASKAHEKQGPAPSSTQQIAEDAYTYGLQQVIFFGQRYTYTQNSKKDNQSYAGVNRLFNVRKKITPDFPVVTPNATTLYGTGFIELQKEPVVIEMPAITDRYFSLQIMSQYGIFYVMVGNQFNGTDARSYIIVPDDYKGKIPGDFATTEVIHAPSKIGYAMTRIGVLTGSDKDIAQINTYQDQISITPLSKWVANGKKGISQSKAKVNPGAFKKYSRMPEIAEGQVDKQSAEDFFSILNMVLNDPSMTLMKDSKKEAGMLAQLATLNIGPGKDFKWAELDKDTQAAMDKGFKNGYDKVKKTFKSNLLNMNGWMVVQNVGGFETDYLSRSVMADAGWAGPDKNVSHGAAFLFTDADDKPLDGKNNYTMTFDMNDLPPCTQFWSIPIYNKDGYFVRNPIDRYTINSYMIDQKQLYIADGKLVIYVQKDKPSDPNQLKNWLPAPEGSFRFAARFYGPYMPLVDGSYKMPRPVIVK